MRVIAQHVEFGGDGLHGGQFGVAIAFLGDQLAAHFSRIEPGVQPLGAKLRIGLALRIDQRRDIGEQVGQMGFGRFATTCTEVLQANHAAL